MAEIRVNCAQSGTSAVSTWNKYVLGSAFANLVTSTGTVTGVGLDAPYGWAEDQVSGPSGANLYDDNVWRTGFRDPAFQQLDSGYAEVTITGLAVGESYTVTAFWTTDENVSFPLDNQESFRLVGDTTTSYSSVLDAQENETGTVSRTVDADSSGEIKLQFKTTDDTGYVLLCGFIIDGTFASAPIIDTSPSTISPGDTNVTIEGSNLTDVDTVNIIWDDVTVAQTGLTIVDDTELNFDFVQGHLPYGLVTLELLIGATSTTVQIEHTPATDYSYLTVEDPIMDHASFESVLDDAPGPTPVDGDQLELHDATGDVTLYQSGLYEISDPTTLTFNARRWSITSHEWEPTEKTFTIDAPVIAGAHKYWYRMLLMSS